MMCVELFGQQAIYHRVMSLYRIWTLRITFTKPNKSNYLLLPTDSNACLKALDA